MPDYPTAGQCTSCMRSVNSCSHCGHYDISRSNGCLDAAAAPKRPADADAANECLGYRPVLLFPAAMRRAFVVLSDGNENDRETARKEIATMFFEKPLFAGGKSTLGRMAAKQIRLRFGEEKTTSVFDTRAEAAVDATLAIVEACAKKLAGNPDKGQNQAFRMVPLFVRYNVKAREAGWWEMVSSRIRPAGFLDASDALKKGLRMIRQHEFGLSRDLAETALDIIAAVEPGAEARGSLTTMLEPHAQESWYRFFKRVQHEGKLLPHEALVDRYREIRGMQNAIEIDAETAELEDGEAELPPGLIDWAAERLHNVCTIWSDSYTTVAKGKPAELECYARRVIAAERTTYDAEELDKAARLSFFDALVGDPDYTGGRGQNQLYCRYQEGRRIWWAAELSLCFRDVPPYEQLAGFANALSTVKEDRHRALGDWWADYAGSLVLSLAEARRLMFCLGNALAPVPKQPLAGKHRPGKKPKG